MTSSAHDLGSTSDFEAGVPRPVRVDGRNLVIVRNGDEFHALRDRCPHQGASLSGGHVTGITRPCKPGEPIELYDQGEILVCPWHGWEFDIRTGYSVLDPQKVRVRNYAVRVQDGRVLVEIENPD